MHAVILAGGKGTRLRPLTDTRPKPLVPFVGDAFAAGLLRRLSAAGCRAATFLVARDRAPFEPLRDLGRVLEIPVDVVAEPEPLGTAGAARDLLRRRDDGPFLVCNGDILTDLDYTVLVDEHCRAGAVATLALTRVEDTSSFGVVDVAGDGTVTAFIEKPPAGSVAADTVNAGTYVLEPAAFEACPSDGPLSFERTVFPGLVQAGRKVLGVTDDGFWLDLGTPDRYLAGQRAVLRGDCLWPVGRGYRHDGGSLVHDDALVDPSARVGPDVVVGPGSRVAAGAHVEASALFERVTVGPGARIRHTILCEDSVVDAGARVADGAVVAPGARVVAAAT